MKQISSKHTWESFLEHIDYISTQTNKMQAFINSRINILDINDIIDLNLNEQKRKIYQRKNRIRLWERVGMKQI
jgi:hypothetical protein